MFDITQAQPGDVVRARDQAAPDIYRDLIVTGRCALRKQGFTIIGRPFGDYPWEREAPERPFDFRASYTFCLIEA
jgi:hypothetical protein